METLTYEEPSNPPRKRYFLDAQIALAGLLTIVSLYLCGAFGFIIYQYASRYSLQVRIPASPLDSFINPKSSLAATGPEFCRLYKDEDGRVGLYELKCKSGVALDVVWSGNGACQMVALGGDRWWQHARSWRVECGEERRWVGGIENGGARWEAWLE
jgi:nitrate reductase NapE component